MGVQPITACIVNGKSTVFYVDEKKFVHTLTSADDGDVENEQEQGRERYNDKILKVGGKSVQSLTKDMVALSYPLRDLNIIRSRLYYADSNGNLQGLEKDGDQDWTQSSIINLGASVEPETSITALLSEKSDSIKVYYFKRGDNRGPWVAWWSGSAGKWATESI